MHHYTRLYTMIDFLIKGSVLISIYEMYSNITIWRVSQLCTDYTGIAIIPEIPAHPTPCSINTHFNVT